MSALPKSQPQPIITSLSLISPDQSTDAQLEAKLAKYLELKERATEFERLKKELKPLFEGQESITIGRFHVTGKSVHSPEKTIKAFDYWRWDIKPAV
jgi:hypothetical protein